MAKNHKSTGSKNIHILRNCLEWSSLKYYSLQPLLDLNIGCVTSFWSQEHKFKLSRSIWSCLENCEEFHQAKQMIPGFKIDSKGADDDSVHIKDSSDAFDRMNHCCKTILCEKQLSSPRKWNWSVHWKMLPSLLLLQWRHECWGRKEREATIVRDEGHCVHGWAPHFSVHVNSLNLWICPSTFPIPFFMTDTWLIFGAWKQHGIAARARV